MRFTLALIASLTATAAFADDQVYPVLTCEGAELVTDNPPLTLSEINVLFEQITPPAEGQNTLMRFELPGGGHSWGFTEFTQSQLAGHCDTQHHMRVKPRDGSWSVDVLTVEMNACPEGVPMPDLSGTIRELSWPAFFTPAPFFRDSPVDFDYQMIDRMHWLATATPSALENARVEVSYDFQAVNRERIDIQGNVNVQVDAGVQKVNCTAVVMMTAIHLSQ